jgi:hypothetical protein
MIALLLVGIAAALMVENEIEQLFDLAVHVYRVSRGS